MSWLLKWCGIGAWVGLLSGLASAGFLWLLEVATRQRGETPWLLYFLPLAGAGIGWLYHHHGKEAAGGNNLLLERIHDPSESVPFRMAPLILFTTIVTHLFGGSAGREGTAVQMGGSLADLAVIPLKLSADDRRLLLMAGIAAGFGSVFGTPIAGAIFGIEVIKGAPIRWNAVVPSLMASFVGDFACRATGIQHLLLPRGFDWEVRPTVILWSLLAGVVFAVASMGFVELAHRLGRFGTNAKGSYWIRPAAGGLVIIGLTLAVGDQGYNGLSLPLILRSFSAESLPLYGFLLKLLFTAVTLGAGFKGGEVTPLFCIGALIGNAFAAVTHQSTVLFSALGFVAVFSAAANTPVACVALGMELFGPQIALPLAVVCFVGGWASGKGGIYPAQYPLLRTFF
ncbi:MAG: chloride channel protein [Armatimonadetes bacterium]|nr:chloride channel protein [Armatimonadota bacterium]